jgi:hypothetical protein
MHTLQLAAEDWSTQAEGMYPADILDQVMGVVAGSTNPSQVSEACPGTNLNVSTLQTTLLPGNATYKNPFLTTGNSLDYSAGVPAHAAIAAAASGQGTSFYEALDAMGANINGASGTGAASYVIYGDGYRAVLDLELRPGI